MNLSLAKKENLKAAQPVIGKKKKLKGRCEMEKKSTLETGLIFAVSFFLAIFVALPQVVNAVTQQWVRTYDGLSDGPLGHDGAAAIAVDINGNVYVTGSSQSNSSSLEYATIKYNSAGKQEWVKTYNAPNIMEKDEATAIAADTKGNVYVTGWSVTARDSDGWIKKSDYATIKYNSAGKRQWVRRYATKRDNYAIALAVDIKGNVYVTGSSHIGYSSDYATIKYNTNGQRQWVRRYDGPGKSSDAANAIAVDTKGNVYVTGYSDNKDDKTDFATIKYNTAGKLQWVQRYHGPNKNRNDSAIAIAVDTKGNVYVTGHSDNEDDKSNFATIKYNTSGKLQWVKRYHGSNKSRSGSEPAAIGVDTKGNVYVTGTITEYNYGDYNFYYATIKYNSNGKQQWVKRYRGPKTTCNIATALAVDAKGNVYVTGQSDDYCATIKYNSSGQPQWVKRYTSPNGMYAGSKAIAVDVKGNVYITGNSADQYNWSDYLTIKYAP